VLNVLVETAGRLIEVAPVKNWLELEFGTTGLFRRHSTEWGTDLLFKKPWDLSPKVEFMLGLGPEWVHSKQYSVTTNSVAAEVVADFMFWPWKKHRFGTSNQPTSIALRAATNNRSA
jgi:hypothetical protein